MWTYTPLKLYFFTASSISVRLSLMRKGLYPARPTKRSGCFSVYWVTSSREVSMYIHLFQYDHILVWVMKTFSTPASSILPSMVGIESNCGGGAHAGRR